jgi:hypothetical protein
VLLDEDNEKNAGVYRSIEADGLTIYTGDWKGYFEHLQSFRVETVLLGA